MKASAIVGAAFLTTAAALAAVELFLPRFDVLMGVTPPAPTASPNPSFAWAKITPYPDDDQAPTPEPFDTPAQRPPHHSQSAIARHKHRARIAIETPLPAPTLVPATPEPRRATPIPVVIRRIAPSQTVRPVPVYYGHPQPTVAPAHHYVARPVDVRVTAPPRPLAPPKATVNRISAESEAARGDVAKRIAIASVQSSYPGSIIRSAETDVHGSNITVIVVEDRTSGTAVESFSFRPGTSGLVQTERRLISVSVADPFVQPQSNTRPGR